MAVKSRAREQFRGSGLQCERAGVLRRHRDRRPRERVYDYVSDLTRHHEWAANTLRIEREGDGFRSYASQLRIENRNILTVVQQQPPVRFAFESLGREGRFRHVFEIEGAAGRSRLTKRFVVLHTPAVMKLLAPFFGIAGRRNMRGDLRRIKARLETQGGPAT